MPQFTTSYIQQLANDNADGTCMGQGNTSTDLISFYGAAPVAQRASAFQAASVVSVSSNITIAASLTAWILEVTNTLVGLGIWKGSA